MPWADPIDSTHCFEKEGYMKTSDSTELETPALRDLNPAELEAVSGGDGCLDTSDAFMTNKQWVENNGVKWPITIQYTPTK
jgi:hypothetical protein